MRRQAIQALSQKVATNLSCQSGTQSISDIEADLANAQTTIKNATSLNTQTQTTLQGMLQGIEGVNQTQIGEQILTLQNSLSASLSVTARLSQISLVNYLGTSSRQTQSRATKNGGQSCCPPFSLGNVSRSLRLAAQSGGDAAIDLDDRLEMVRLRLCHQRECLAQNEGAEIGDDCCGRRAATCCLPATRRR